MTTRQVLRLVWVSLGAVSVLAACGARDNPGAIIWPHPEGSSASVTTPDITPGDPVTLGGLVICVEGAESGEVVSVRAPSGSHVQITEFTLRAQDRWEMFGGDRIALADTGIPTGRTTVDTRCDAELWTELIVEVRSDGQAHASASELIVDFRVGDRAGSTPIAFGVGLCAPGVEPCEI